MHIEIRSIESDVRLYLHENLRGRDYLSGWIDASPELEEAMISAILPRLSGMFLLARLYVDILAQMPTVRGVKKALKGLPEGTDSTYAEAWERICVQKPHQADVGRRVIAWIVCATRPLRVSELQSGLAVEEGDSDLDAEGLLDISSLTSFCAGLVVIDDQSNQISLVHPTANEYFVRRQGLLFPLGHKEMAIACTTYLLIDSLQGVSTEPDDFIKRYREHKFLGYAAVNWGVHVGTSSSKTSLELARRLLNNHRARSSAAQALMLNTLGASERISEWPVLSSVEIKRRNDRYRYEFENSLKSVDALHLAAYFGLSDLLEDFIKSGDAIEQQDGMGATAVHWAILGNQTTTLRSLLHRGANVHAHRQACNIRRWYTEGAFCGFNPDLTYPLHVAACLGHLNAIQLLLDFRADIDRLQAPYDRRNAMGSEEKTALTVALTNDQSAAGELLLARGADVNGDRSLVEYITQFGTLDSLKMLIPRGINKRSLGEAFSLAINLCRYEFLVVLIEAGVEVKDNPAPAPAVSRYYRSELIDQSDKHPSDNPCNFYKGQLVIPGPNYKNNRFEYSLVKLPLIDVVTSGFREAAIKCASILISSGADVNRIGVRDYIYADDWTWCGNLNDDLSGINTVERATTALHTAAYYQNCDMIEFLVREGADVNLVIDDHYTALKSALDGEGYDDDDHQKVCS